LHHVEIKKLRFGGIYSVCLSVFIRGRSDSKNSVGIFCLSESCHELRWFRNKAKGLRFWSERCKRTCGTWWYWMDTHPNKTMSDVAAIGVTTSTWRGTDYTAMNMEYELLWNPQVLYKLVFFILVSLHSEPSIWLIFCRYLLHVKQTMTFWK